MRLAEILISPGKTIFITNNQTQYKQRMFHNFLANQSVELLVPHAPLPITKYLEKPQRIVNALGDANRVDQLSEQTYRLKMRPLKFFALKIEPLVDIRLWTEDDGVVHLQSFACELKGMEMIKDHFKLNLYGTMEPHQSHGNYYLKGGAELGLVIFLPAPFTMMPKSLVEKTGNNLLGSVLLRMKQKLMEQMLLDYSAWANQEARSLTNVA